MVRCDNSPSSPGQDHTWLDLNSGLFVPPALFPAHLCKTGFYRERTSERFKVLLASFPSLSPPFLIFLKVKSTSSLLLQPLWRQLAADSQDHLSHTLIRAGIMELSLQAYERGWLFCSPNIQRKPLFFCLLLFLFCFVSLIEDFSVPFRDVKATRRKEELSLRLRDLEEFGRKFKLTQNSTSSLFLPHPTPATRPLLPIKCV